jgi:uncharacterized membrane protein YhaH (DUF805 family)
MFEKPFSFEGRIRRTEYGLSMLFYSIAYVFLMIFIESAGEAAIILTMIFLIPGLWFIWAQGAKRCHDLGNSGWFQLIPFYGLLMMFQDSQAGINKYGENPKGIQGGLNHTAQGSQNFNSNMAKQNGPATTGGYQGGYLGGHNKPTTSYIEDKKTNNSGGYKDGDLYN